MGDILGWVERVLLTVMQPVRWLMETVGLQPTDMQVWALMVAVFMVAFLGPTTYGDLVLMRRRRRATGTVISIDDSGEYASPRIGFRDQTGTHHEFDSPLSLNNRTSVIGGEVEVIYDPAKPTRAREANRVLQRLLLVVMWYGFALGLLAYAVGAVE